MVFELVTSRVSDVPMEIHYSWYVDEVVIYPIHHSRSCIASSLFQAGPPKCLQHGRDAQVPPVLSADETRLSSSDHLKLVDAVLGMRVPDCGNIFYDWLEHVPVALCFHLRWAATHVPPNECERSVGITTSSSLCARSTIICGRRSLRGTSHCQQQVAVFHLECSCDGLVSVC